MKKLMAASLIALSFSTLAVTDLIKTHDGSVVTCKSKSDVSRHVLGGIYRPVKMNKALNSSDITIEFLRCTQSGDSFKFVRDHSFEQRASKVTDFGTRDLSKRNIQISRSNITLLAYNGKGDLIDRQTLEKNEDGTYSTSITTKALNYDNSPAGRSSFEISVQSQFTLDDLESGANIDRGLENLGSFRLVVK